MPVMRRIGVWVALALLILYLVFVSSGWLGITDPGVRALSVVLAGMALGSWAIVARLDPAWRPRSVLLPAIVVCLASLAISTAFSRYPRISVEYLGYAVLLASLYLLLVQLLRRPFFRARMGALIPTLGLVLAAAFVVTNVGSWVGWWALIGHLAVPPLRPESESLVFGNPSAAMAMVLLVGCSAIALLEGPSRIRRAVRVGLALMILFGIVVSGSRAGWIAIGIATLATAIIFLAASERRARARRQLRSWTASGPRRAAAVAGGVIAVVAGVILAPVVVRRLTDGGEDLRLNFLLAAGRVFSDSPILGTGPGTWVIQRIRYTIPPETDYYIPHAHDVYAQTAAELGIVGLVAGLLLAICVAWLVRDGLRDADVIRRRWGWVATFVVLYFAAHQLLDFHLNMPAALFAAAFPVAWLDATTTRPLMLAHRPLADRLERIPTLLGAAIVAVVVVGLLATEVPAATEATAVADANAGQWAQADTLAQEAVRADPGWAPYQFTAGLTAANVGDHERAAAAFRRVAASDDLPEAWLDLAAEELQLHQAAAVGDALNHAARLGLQRTAIAMAIGDLADRLGNTALSDAAFTAAIAQVPSLAGDPWWLADPVRKRQFPRLVDAAVAATAPGNAWQIPLMAGDVARARGLLPLASYVAGTLVPDDVIAAWTGDDAAFQRILAVCDAHPLDGAALGWAARLEARRGNIDAADRYRRWAYEGAPDAVAVGTELRVSPAPLLDRQAAGGLAEFWGAYTYRRPTPWNLLVPSLVQLTLE